MEGRSSLLASMLPETADAALIISETNRRYFTDFASDAGYLLLTREKTFLLVDFRYTEAAKNKAKGAEVIEFKKLSDTILQIAQENNIKNILIEGSGCTVNDALTLDEILAPLNIIKSKELDRLIGKLRIIKSGAETEKIIAAQRITEKALLDTLPLIKEGVMERDIALELEYRIKKLGAEDISFDLITIAGAKTSMPHGVPDDYRIRPGDFITFDIGAVYQGYHSDMTRTYALGQITEKQKKVYHTVFLAQQKGLDAVKSGITAGSVDKAARDLIAQAGYDGYFGHSTGHGVGLDIHELPKVGQGDETILQSGMIITVEPGIYLPGEFGVRIEDTVAVTNEGCINLCTLPKELTIIG